jgi:hypothetical protein
MYCRLGLFFTRNAFSDFVNFGIFSDFFSYQSAVGSCYLEVSFGTTGVDTWCYLVLPGVA